MKKFLTTFIIAVTLFVSFGIAKSAWALAISPVRFEIELDPGTVYNGEHKLRNETSQIRTYYSSYANFQAQGETGTPSFVEAQEGLATWITTEEKVTLLPNESKTVPFTIAVPADAQPGGNFAALFWSSSPADIGPDGDTSQVVVNARLGMLVLLRVSGDVEIEGGVLEYGLEGDKKVYSSLPVDFYYRVQNSGEDLVRPLASATIKSLIGRTVATLEANPTDGNVLPNSIRRFEFGWGEVIGQKPETWSEKLAKQKKDKAFGRYVAKLAIDYSQEELEDTNDKVVFWVLPPQLIIVRGAQIFGGLLLLMLFARYQRRMVQRSYRNMQSNEVMTKSHQAPASYSKAVKKPITKKPKKASGTVKKTTTRTAKSVAKTKRKPTV